MTSAVAAPRSPHRCRSLSAPTADGLWICLLCAGSTSTAACVLLGAPRHHHLIVPLFDLQPFGRKTTVCLSVDRGNLQSRIADILSL